MGGLFCAGWTLDDLLDLTWDQIQVVSACVVEYRAFQMNTILEVVSSAMGGTVDKPASAVRKRKKQKRAKSKPKPPDLMARFSGAGIGVSTMGGDG